MIQLFSIQDRLILKNPNPQTALDLFKGTWISKLPEPYCQMYEAGQLTLFEDTRIQEGIKFLGPVKDKTVLDLGPLEGAHAYILEKLGARHIVSVEANSLLYLKCLVMKEVLGMKVHFLCGDVIKYLEICDEAFDICVVSGILYHMIDPVELLWLLSKKIDKLIIWTHYFDELTPSRNKLTSFNGTTIRNFDGIDYTYHRQEYGVGFETNIYCGGTSNYSNWMSKSGIWLALKKFGYTVIHELQDSDSVNGPFTLLTAQKEI